MSEANNKIAAYFSTILRVLREVEDNVRGIAIKNRRNSLTQIISTVNETDDDNLSEKEIEQKREINHYYSNIIEPMIEKYMSLKAFW
jgi:hypothetical protein